MTSTTHALEWIARRTGRVVAPACAALVLILAPPARAELVVLSGGRVLHVRSAVAHDQRMVLALDNGGQMILPIDQVEHVVEDELDRRLRPTWLPRLDVVVRFDGQSEPPATPYGTMILAAAREHGLNPHLVTAVVQAESDFHPGAVSSRGAVGLMQVMPATARRFGVAADRLDDPTTNLFVGTRYLRWLADRFADDLPMILAGYNAGEGVVERFDGVPPYRETHDYILRVYRLLGRRDHALAR
jgi:hypothetical protein